MLKGSAVVDLVNAIVPLYLSIALGYGATKLRILPFEQNYAGIGGFAAKFAVPFLIFQMVSTNDPYIMNLKVIGADTIYKMAALLVLALGGYYRPTHQYVAWVSVVFNLLTMPNSVLIGTPLCTALYPGTATDVTTLVFMQCLLWSSVCILILEIHKAVYENSKDFEIERMRALGVDCDEENNNAQVKGGDTIIPVQDGNLLEMKLQQQREVADGVLAQLPLGAVAVESKGNGVNYAEQGVVKVKLTKRQVAKQIVRTVLYKFFWSPVVWASIVGFAYSLLNFKFNHGKPLPVILGSLVDLIANCTLGLCMFMLGMSMAVAKKLFACGLPKALLGAGARFLVAPACMAVVSFAIGLRGNMFRFAVMQAMVPQAVLSFVWHSQYNIHADIFSTAVWFQTAIFFPFAIGLDLLLSSK